MNIMSARAFMAKSGQGSGVLNFLNARAFRPPHIRPECARIQDSQSGRCARTQDVHDAPCHERALTGYPEIALVAVMNILNARAFRIFRTSRMRREKRAIAGFDNPGGEGTIGGDTTFSR